jgi:hypothetical protein
MNNLPLKEHIKNANFLYSLKNLDALSDPKRQLIHWHKYRTLHADFIKKNSDSYILNEMKVTGFSEEKPPSNFFLLFHHGFYFTIPYWMIKQYGYTGARFIMTKESFDERTANSCANSLGEDYKAIFIDDKGMFVREVIKAKRNNYCIFLLTDLPFGYTDATTDSFQAPFGKLKFRHGYLKIAKLMKQSPYLITNHINKDFSQVNINITEINEAKTLQNKLSEIYLKEPLTSERIDDLAKMCTFNNSNINFTHEFEFQDKKYRYYPAESKLFAIE